MLNEGLPLAQVQDFFVVDEIFAPGGDGIQVQVEHWFPAVFLIDNAVLPCPHHDENKAFLRKEMGDASLLGGREGGRKGGRKEGRGGGKEEEEEVSVGRQAGRQKERQVRTSSSSTTR